MEVTIVYEDAALLVINKPAGLIVHQKNETDKQPSLVDWVIEKYPALADVGEPFIASGFESRRAGIVHRLDKETSGLILVAKNNDTFYFLKKQFQEHTIKKSYLALVYGRPAKSPGVIDAPLGRVGMKRTTRLEGTKLIDGKASVTEYESVKFFKDYTLVDVHPKTGRTHQIRVHLKSINCPIAGDTVYAPKGWSRPCGSRIRDSRSESGQPCMPTGLTRLFLHAYKLSFITPDGKSLTIECDLPDDLQKVITMLQ